MILVNGTKRYRKRYLAIIPDRLCYINIETSDRNFGIYIAFVILLYTKGSDDDGLPFI